MATTSPHANATGTDLHEDKRVKAPVNAASTAQVPLATPGPTIDGVTLASGNRVLLKNQTAPAENGIYVWTGAGVALTRASDADVAADFTLGFLVFVATGTINGSTLWLFSQVAALTLGTTAITFAAMGALGPTGPTGPIGPQGSVGPPGPVSVVSATPYICIQEQQPSGTGAGTFTSGAWRTRLLNKVTVNDFNTGALVGNQIVLPAGTWRCAISAPGFQVNAHSIRLQNITAGITVLAGMPGYADSGIGAGRDSYIRDRFSISATTTFEVQHRCQTTGATTGFGNPNGTALGGVLYEVYAIAEFWLEGLPSPVCQGMGIQPNPSFEVTYRRTRSAWGAM